MLLTNECLKRWIITCRFLFDLKGASIYYAGPTPAPAGMPIGSCGPTTAGRMDKFAPRLLDLGLTCMIGKENAPKRL